MRINNPQLFNGQYLASREQIFEKLGLGVVSSNAQGFEISGLINEKYLDVASIFNTDTFKGKFTEIENLIGTVSGAAISVAAGTGITVTGDGTEKTIAVDSSKFALSGIGGDDTYASKYALMFNGEQVGTTTINIPKDQFLEDAIFIASATSEDVTASGNEVTVGKPCIKFTFAVKVKDASTGAETEEEKVVYVPVDGLVDIYTGGNGIAIENNVVSAVIDSASEGFLTVDAAGLKLSGVQDAIDTAAGNALSSANAYTDVVSGALSSAFDEKLENLTSGAVTELSGKVDANTAAISGNADDIAANRAYINYVSGQVSGLPTAIATAKAEAISAAKGYTDEVSGNLDTAAKGYANAAQAAAEATAKTYADGLDFAQIVQLPGELGNTIGEVAAAKDTLYVGENGQTGIVLSGTTEVIKISQSVESSVVSGSASLVTSDAIYKAIDAAKTELTEDIGTVSTAVDALYKIAEVSGVKLPYEAPGRVIAVYSDAGDKEQCYPTVKPVGDKFVVSADGLVDADETFTISYYVKPTA